MKLLIPNNGGLVKIIKALSCLLAVTSMFYFANLNANCCGKVDVGPIFMHVDVLESGHTVKRMDIGGIRADAAIKTDCGFCFKPTVTYGVGHGHLFSGGAGLGFCIPVCDGLIATPLVGCNYTNLRTYVNLHFPGATHLKERFRSVSPYVGLEATYTICTGWRLGGFVQYAWSRTHTTLSHLASDRSWSKGFNYAASLEKDLNEKWSVNAAIGYNNSLSKEKHGLRGYGVKLGLVYWFGDFN